MQPAHINSAVASSCAVSTVLLQAIMRMATGLHAVNDDSGSLIGFEAALSPSRLSGIEPSWQKALQDGEAVLCASEQPAAVVGVPGVLATMQPGIWAQQVLHPAMRWAFDHLS